MVQPSGSCSSCEVFTVSQIKREGLSQTLWYRRYYSLQEAGLYRKSFISCLKLFPLVVDEEVMKKERKNWRAYQFPPKNFMFIFVCLFVFSSFLYFCPLPPPHPTPIFDNRQLINNGPTLYLIVPFFQLLQVTQFDRYRVLLVCISVKSLFYWHILIYICYDKHFWKQRDATPKNKVSCYTPTST